MVLPDKSFLRKVVRDIRMAELIRASQAGMMPGVVLPADSHVHSEWSWDAPDGSMERTCARAVDMGLPAVAFTDRADYTAWKLIDSDFDGHEQLTAFVTQTEEIPGLPPFDTS
jgi:PHP domain